MWLILLSICILFFRFGSTDTWEENPDAEVNFNHKMFTAFKLLLQSLREDKDSRPHFVPTINKIPEPDANKTTKKLNSVNVDIQVGETHGNGMVPSYSCDDYDLKTHTCTNMRQIGTTLTIGIQGMQPGHRIRWFRCFKKRESLSNVQEELTKDKLPWNINLGGEFNELRISPITEIDFSYNYFIATASAAKVKKRLKRFSRRNSYVKFIIEPIPIDMGPLYYGEELILYARAFMELPLKSLTLKWTLSDSNNDLPSNMKTNDDGTSIIVKELKTTSDKILTCSVFSNKNIFLAKRDFFFRNNGRNHVENGKILARKKRSLSESEGFEYEDVFSPQKSQQSKDFRHHFSRSIDKFKYRNPGDISNIKSLNSMDDSIFAEKTADNHRINSKPEGRFPQHTEWNENSQNGNQYSRLRDYPSTKFQNPESNQFSENIPSPLEHNGNFFNNFDKSDENRKDPKPDLFRSDEKDFFSDNESPVEDIIQQVNSMVRNDNVESLEDLRKELLTFDDSESMLIADCKEDVDCSNHATCIKNTNGGKNFCKCLLHYKGNGIFCWYI